MSDTAHTADAALLEPSPDEVVGRVRRAVAHDGVVDLSEFHWHGHQAQAVLDGYRAVHAGVTAWAGPPASDDGDAGGSPASAWVVDGHLVELYAHLAHPPAVLQVGVGPAGGWNELATRR